MAQSKKTTATKTKSAPAKSQSGTRAKSAAKTAVPPPPPPAPAETLRPEITGALFLLLAVCVGIGFFNTDGAVIAFIANFFKGMLGWGYFLTAPVFLLAAGIFFFQKQGSLEGRVFAALLLPIFGAALCHMLLGDLMQEGFDFQLATGTLFTDGLALRSGGVVGGLIAIGLTLALSSYGAWPLLFVLFVLCLLIAVRGNLRGLFSGARERRRALHDMLMVQDAPVEQARPQHPEVPELLPEEPVLQPVTRSGKAKSAQKIERVERPVSVDLPLGDEEELPLPLSGPEAAPPAEEKPRRARVRRKSGEEEPTASVKPLSPREAAEIAGVKLDEGFKPFRNEKKAEAPVTLAGEISDPPKGKKQQRAEVEAEARAVADAVAANAESGDYQFPPTELLRSPAVTAVDARDEIAVNRERLESALHSFGISSSIVGFTRGPTVTRYDIELEQGVKLSRVTNLAGDLALALGVVNVRIAPIPDMISTVGIEVPNKLVSTVYLREIIESPRFKGAKSKLSFALGKDIGGECVVGNIAKLPHMLIAGTTGSGKSVCMNSLILSLLYKARPDEVRLIMIDPKMVELGVYNGIPHLYVPVVTDPKKAAGALQWSVVEMLKRYRLFSEVGVRDLENYNRHCRAAEQPTLPAVVIVIDELADLMLVASKEVEESICRVAQMGRAAGMHLVIATQRPSADVITGLMKANIPSRIAFAVSSSLESRIILDQVGAEKLVGMGDMLFSPVGLGKPMRIQGAFVSDEEREEVIQFIKESAGESTQNAEIEDFMNKASEDKGSESGKSAARDEDSAASGYDEMLPQAVEVVLEAGSCSVSMLQRRAKLGYARAARIVDQMEELGVVGPYEGAKPRAVVIDRAGWQELAVKLGFAAGGDYELAAEMSAQSEESEA